MAKMEVKIVEDNTETIKTLMIDAMRIALEAVGLQGERNAKKEVTTAVYDTPESPNYTRTGNLRNTITHFADEKYAYIGVGAEYASYVEFGTSKMPARPFIKPAITNHVDEYARIFEHYAKNA